MTKIRRPLASAALAAILLAGQAPGMGARAQGTPAPAKPWVVSCSDRGLAGGLNCAMTQVLIAKNTGQRVVGAAIFRTGDRGAIILRLSLPHGLRLPDGVRVSIDDGKRTTVPIETADQNGSYANIPVAGDFLAALKRGHMLSVAVTSVRGEEAAFQLSLDGFTAAFDKL
ncbi:invasion associated locus B family protein [Propylenella binzhouense]|uniref:Invasion associated locus B family protein n=1 Tax=Propylenella binzhouense TaxID=2555902 RepID=A0A964WUT0_9HYPH|nr:invasion associated locus B family protein [Propylenella binzhouense]